MASRKRNHDIMHHLDMSLLHDEDRKSGCLLSGPTAEEILLALNLRYDWRGFSFGNFWFGYYFTFPQPSPSVEERLAV